ncbi:MAG: carboxypeptidase regulatory-like domain-containing protein [Deltaproteobacteria bacterium]|nr:carboxypeptidase regulatory-like domain-containing protein [Deltaproteobacteria bacterium]
MTDGTAGPPLELRLDRGLSISGRVLDPEGRPVAGAFVEVHRPGAPPGDLWLSVGCESGIDGYYECGELSPGVHQVHAVARGFAATDRIEVAVGSEGATADLPLTVGGHLLVRVDDARGDPAANVRVVLTDSAGEDATGFLLVSQPYGDPRGPVADGRPRRAAPGARRRRSVHRLGGRYVPPRRGSGGGERRRRGDRRGATGATVRRRITASSFLLLCHGETSRSRTARGPSRARRAASRSTRLARSGRPPPDRTRRPSG